MLRKIGVVWTHEDPPFGVLIMFKLAPGHGRGSVMPENHFHTARDYQRLGVSGLTPSLEDYLEMIARNLRSSGYVRVSQLAQELNVKPSSVSKMIIKLAELGLLDYEKYGVIKLTEKGRKAGSYLLWRHDVIRSFFSLLELPDEKKAFEEVELVEHILSEETVLSLERLIQRLKGSAH